MTAAASGNMDALNLLIQAGACLGKQDKNGRTAAEILKAKLGAGKFETLLTQSIAKFDATLEGLDFPKYAQRRVDFNSYVQA